MADAEFRSDLLSVEQLLGLNNKKLSSYFSIQWECRYFIFCSNA